MSDSNSNQFEEVTIATKSIFEGRVISLQVDEVRLPNGETAAREIVRHPGAVAIIALLGDKDRLLVVEQYRKPLGKNQVEIPAGKLEPGEDPLEAAKRELEEETGYRAGTIRHFSSFYTSPGFADEMLHVYIAEELTEGQVHLDEDEFLECRAITLEEAEALITGKQISDAKTILAVYAWRMYKLTGRL